MKAFSLRSAFNKLEASAVAASVASHKIMKGFSLRNTLNALIASSCAVGVANHIHQPKVAALEGALAITNIVMAGIAAPDWRK